MKSNLMYFYIPDVYRINEIDLNDFVKETKSTYRKNYSKITFYPRKGVLFGELTIAKLGEPAKQPITIIASRSVDKLNEYANMEVFKKYESLLSNVDDMLDTDCDRLNDSYLSPIRVDGF